VTQKQTDAVQQAFRGGRGKQRRAAQAQRYRVLNFLTG